MAAVVTVVGSVLVVVAPVGARQAAYAAETTAASRSTREIASNGVRPFPAGQGSGTSAGTGLASGEPRPDRPAARFDRGLSPRPASGGDAQRAASANGLSVPVVNPVAVSTDAGQATTSFNGLDFFDQRFANGGNQQSVEPPDQGLCVGNGFVLESVNDVLQVFSPEGKALSPPTDLNSFYGYPAQFDRTKGTEGPSLTDPTCVFDAGTQRWFHVVLTLDVNRRTGQPLGSDHLDIAVSRTANPLGAWNFYTVAVQDNGDAGTPHHTGCPCIGDYPHIAVDAHGFYVTTNEYPFSGARGEFGNNFNGAQLYAFSKEALAARTPARVIQFENLAVGTGKAARPGFTLSPAQANPGHFATENDGTQYFVSSVAGNEALGTGMADNVVLWSLLRTDTLATANPDLVLKARNLKSEIYGVPPLSEQKLGSVPLRDCLVVTCLKGIGPSDEVEGPLDSGDSRMYQAWFADGMIYAALGTVMSVNGEVKAGAAWFAVSPDGSPAVADQGYVGVAQGNVIYPAVAVAPGGVGAMAFTLVGRDWFPSAAYVMFQGGSPTGPVRVAAKGKGPQDGFSEYDFFSSPDPAQPRWGDYGAAVTDGRSIWLASEYIDQTCKLAEFAADPTCGGTRGALGNWGTRVTRIR
jgi:hypothetical protein